LSGTYATHMVLRKGSTVVTIARAGELLPASLALCCMMNCGGATAVASARACGSSVAGGRVAVMGGGPLGLLTALRAADLGATEVAVIDKNKDVAAVARKFGFETELTGE
jgi:threonine dehydrogenase-like Zn-dependent dehydrogenase